MSNLEQLFNQAVDHRNNHDCSAYPYENYQKLFDTVLGFKAKYILEIGTGMGFTSAVIANASPDIKIDTIEKDAIHAQTAKDFLLKNGVDGQVNVINDIAELVLSSLIGQYDLIFFDGYQIHYEFLPHYERLLKPNGILFLGNNHLGSRTSDQFFQELTSNRNWKILEKFADTTVAKRLQ